MEIKLYVTIEIPDEDSNYEEIMENPEKLLSDYFDYNIIDLEIK